MLSRTRAREKARQWISRNALIADTETTGLARHDEVVELAIVDCRGATVFHEFVRPTVPVSSSARRVHGISERDLLDCCDWEGMHSKFCRLIESSQLVFYNASFDKRLLIQTINKFGTDVPHELADAECAMHLYKSYRGGGRFSLDAAATHLGVVSNGRAHSALNDCLTTLGVIKAMAI